jgi:MFS family permease
MAVAGALLPRLGSRRIVAGCLVGSCVAGPLVGLTGSLPGLFAALLLWGAFQGSLDVAMNTQAIAVERAGRRTIMPGLHGGWSIGSFAGAGIGALAVGAGIGLTAQLLVLGTLALLVVGPLVVRMLPDRGAPATATGRPTSRWSGGMVLLGAIVFAGMLAEGAAADWAAVYLSGSLAATGAVPGLAYAAFCLAMLGVRLGINRPLERYGSDRVLPVLATVATAGFAAALLLNRPATAIIGFAVLGIGLAAVVPAVLSAAGRIPGLHPGTAVATASACGWAGFVAGPPVIGYLADLTALPVALGLLPVLTAFVAAGTRCAPALRPISTVLSGASTPLRTSAQTRPAGRRTMVP